MNETFTTTPINEAFSEDYRFKELTNKYKRLSKDTLVELLALREFEEQNKAGHIPNFRDIVIPNPHVSPSIPKPIDEWDWKITCSTDCCTNTYKKHKNPLTD